MDAVKSCDQCKRTDVEEVELREEVNSFPYSFKGTLCPKHAAEWRQHFADLMARKRAGNG